VFLDLALLLELVQQVLEAVGHVFKYDLVIKALKDVADSSLILVAEVSLGLSHCVEVWTAAVASDTVVVAVVSDMVVVAASVRY
jgi:hypothetical protein